ncbi:helix-turn-helix transcriptional regulator, partial [Staphylococcus aureus]|nr:helix-turn-helix transcriptional regulator [Staphylococcus aureus]
MRLNKGSIIEKMKNQNIKTQTELAEKIDISKSQLSFMFSDEYEPLKKNVIKLAD